MFSAGREELAAGGGQTGAVHAAKRVCSQQTAGQGPGDQGQGIGTLPQVGAHTCHVGSRLTA